MSEYEDFLFRITQIHESNTRYREDAYFFVMGSLTRAIRSLKKPRHITGKELLRVVLAEGKERFGPMAASVFRHWGIKNSLDFGHIVFNMVHAGVLSKTENDSLEDFQEPGFFQKLFDDAAGYRLREEWKTLKNHSEAIPLSKAEA